MYTQRMLNVCMFRHQNAGQYHNIHVMVTCNFENMAKFRYFGTTVTNEN